MIKMKGINDLERLTNFALNGGDVKESADLAFYLVKNSTTPDRFKSANDFYIPGQMQWIGSLDFKMSKGEFYKKIAEFYTARPHRKVNYDRIKTLLDCNPYHFEKNGKYLKVKDINNLTGMIVSWA